MKFLTHTIITITIALFGFTAASANTMQSADADSVALTEKEQQELFERLEQGLIYGLSSDVYGVVDSALFNAVHYKTEYPDFTSERVKEMINDLALNAKTHTLRFKAYLTLAYYKNQSEFSKSGDLAEVIDNQDQNRVFYHLQNTVSSDETTVSN
ncbi:MAG: hypothetical protein JJU46_00630 [Balneolaceae bacterium]|nr:hypothetical protein [Balneolaceae bacterium]MCH8548060.1 hypothetical protein [Balneolaceae bacterium]